MTLIMNLTKIHTDGITSQDEKSHHGFSDEPEEEMLLKGSNSGRLFYITEPYCKISQFN